jgi:hypothetical protein
MAEQENKTHGKLNVCEINKYVINQIKQDLERVPNTEHTGYSEEPLRQRNTSDKYYYHISYIL